MSELRRAAEAVGREMEALRSERDALALRVAALEAALLDVHGRIVTFAHGEYQSQEESDCMTVIESAKGGDTSSLRALLVEAAYAGVLCIGAGGDDVDHQQAEAIADRILKGGVGNPAGYDAYQFQDDDGNVSARNPDHVRRAGEGR